MADVIFLTPSELLANRANDQADGQVFVQPDLVVITGSLRAITTDELEAHHAAAREVHEIAEHINAQWREINATRLTLHATWIKRDYLPGIQRRREAAIRAQAEEQRRRAAIERMIDAELNEST